MMTATERFANLMQKKEIDRLPTIEWAPFWNLTLDRWNKEGLGVDVKSHLDYLKIQRSFGLEGCAQTLFWARSHLTPTAKTHGAGIMKTRADYLKIKPTMYLDVTKYLGDDYISWLKKTRADGDTLHFMTVEGFFWMPRELFGIEDHLYSFYDQPDLYHEICSDYCDWLKTVVEYVGNEFRFDFMSFAEDMSYNNGPMLSKDLFDEFLLPYYKKIIPLFKKAGIPVFIDSDGDITMAVDWYAEAGAQGMFPLERQAGVDVGLYIQKQPDMFFLGHFDKMCMKKGEAAMRAEFERLKPSLKSRKLIPSVDHQTPPDVSIENYKVYVRLLKEYSRCI